MSTEGVEIFQAYKLYSLHRATSFYTDLQLNAPLIFLAAKPWKIIGVFTFLAPVKPLTVMSQSPATLRRGPPSIRISSRSLMSALSLYLCICQINQDQDRDRKSLNSTLFLGACKTKIADDPVLRGSSPLCAGFLPDAGESPYRFSPAILPPSGFRAHLPQKSQV
ncbi:TPA: hypothetical protein ACG1TJ_004492 [Salmonella enterica]